MIVSLDPNIFKWLFDLNVISVKAQKTDKKIVLDENLSKEFMNGYKIGLLLKKIANLQVNLKQVNSTGVKLYNWNIIATNLNQIGVALDNDIKIMIVQGDTEMLNELLKDIFDKFKPLPPKQYEQLASKVNSQVRLETFDLQSIKDVESRVINFKDDTPEQPNGVKLGEIDVGIPIEKTQSLIELFLTSLCRHLKLKPKQAIGLLANNNKYLAHVMVKGQKNQYQTIISWLMDIHQNVKQVEFYVTQNQEEIQIFFQTLRSGLLSRSLEVATWTLRIYHKLIFELINIDLMVPVYQWFVSEHGGLMTTFLCLKRHQELGSSVVQIYSLICQHNINDFFNIQFRKVLSNPSEYIDLINNIWSHLITTKILKDELLHNKLIDFWGQQALKLVENEIKGSTQERIIGIKFVIQQWIVYPTSFEQDSNKINQFLFLLKKATRANHQVLRYYSLECLFRMLDHLAATKNAYASLLYKKATFSLIENYGEPEIKQFIISNLIYIIKKYNSIPIEIVVVPLTRQIMINSNQQLQINISDFELFRVICLHPKLDVGLAVQVLDVLNKIYLSTIGFSLLAFSPIQILLSKFIENEPIQEFTFNLVKVCLSKYSTSLQSGSNVNQVRDQELIVAFQNNEYERKRVLAQNRAQIIELLKFIINLQQSQLNSQIKPVLCYFYVDIYNLTKTQNKGMMTLLYLYGNPETIIQEFQLQQNLQQQIANVQLPQVLIQTTKSNVVLPPRPQFLFDNVPPNFTDKHSSQSNPQKKRLSSQNSGDSLWDSMPKTQKTIPNDNYFKSKPKSKEQKQKKPNPDNDKILSNVMLTADEEDLLQQFELL